ncbi:MAG: dihydrodipicolinate synthase family protein [Bryobacteraceae bacterium]
MPFTGVNAAAVPPRTADGALDLGAALEVVDYLCRAGVKGIALLGATGEFIHLNFDERTRLAYMAVKRSRVPVLAGVSHSRLDVAVELGREAWSAGAAGLLVMPPYFFRYRQAEIREFYLRLAAEMPRGAPLYLYNLPAFTSAIEPETAAELLRSGLFAGIKDSSGDAGYFDRLGGAGGEFLAGDDAVYPRVRAAGAHGTVSGAACAVPELMLALDRAIAGDGAAGPLEARLLEFNAWVDRFPTPVAIRAAVAARDVKVGPPAVPLSGETRRGLDEFVEWFRGWLPRVQHEAGEA